jgi:hypothetical protein
MPGRKRQISKVSPMLHHRCGQRRFAPDVEPGRAPTIYSFMGTAGNATRWREAVCVQSRPRLRRNIAAALDSAALLSWRPGDQVTLAEAQRRAWFDERYIRLRTLEAPLANFQDPDGGPCLRSIRRHLLEFFPLRGDLFLELGEAEDHQFMFQMPKDRHRPLRRKWEPT